MSDIDKHTQGIKLPKSTRYLLSVLKEESLHFIKAGQFLKHAEINKSKFKAMSKRRQKVYMGFFTSMYNYNTGKLADRRRYKERFIRGLPIYSVVDEPTLAPFNRFWEAWAAHLFEDK
ncbi:hypothetical protein AH04_165 [Erwinia phage AH04]|uniref:Uncharacterized protein n=1 Tax=Erwinia phage AH04 TaxID=2869569 RepID=A0AAE7X0M9_9CAUD|nr:hypothetical protein PQC02_gp149 [Erwinia phage AH04]QZA70640.1 hypothetical protein AH04_165 [Erwinia phage AH04]